MPILKSRKRRSYWFLQFVLLLVILPFINFANMSFAFSQSPDEWVNRFNNYITDYRGLLKKCLPNKSNVRMFIDISNCIWRKEQVLLKRYKLEELLYDVSYDRYSEMFEMGKTAGVQFYNGGTGYFAEASARLQATTEELQVELIKDFLIKNFELRN